MTADSVEAFGENLKLQHDQGPIAEVNGCRVLDERKCWKSSRTVGLIIHMDSESNLFFFVLF